MTDFFARPCDACGKPIGDGYKHCPKCNIYLCWCCGYVLRNLYKKYPEKCPMCGENLNNKLAFAFLEIVSANETCANSR